MRLFIAVRTKSEANALLGIIPNSELLDPEFASDQLRDFRDGGIPTLIACGQFSVTGYRLPEDTTLLLGPGWSGAEEAQIRGRLPIPAEYWAIPSRTIGSGCLVGLKDRNGTEIHIGDVLSFDPEEWGGPCEFTVGWSNGELDIMGTPADLSEWCTVVKPWNQGVD